eukprot:750722-Hanusia_phi.AAC.2
MTDACNSIAMMTEDVSRRPSFAEEFSFEPDMELLGEEGEEEACLRIDILQIHPNGGERRVGSICKPLRSFYIECLSKEKPERFLGEMSSALRQGLVVHCSERFSVHGETFSSAEFDVEFKGLLVLGHSQTVTCLVHDPPGDWALILPRCIETFVRKQEQSLLRR